MRKNRSLSRLGLVCGLTLAAMGSVPSRAEDVAPQSPGGPPIPGICVLNREAVFTMSKVGQDVTAQFRQAHDSSQREVDDEQAKLAGEIKALESQQNTLPADQYQARLKDLAGALRDLRLDAAQKSADLDAARQDAVKKIAEKAQPFIAAVYQRYRCSLLLSRDAVLAGNPGMDVTPEVIKGLDGAITSMAFAVGKHS